MFKGPIGVAKSFLRSGGLLDIYALGEQGRPVYASALQIRETLRLRQLQRIADCLAIPQANESGDRIDWYSPRPGKVCSWAGAGDEERASALAELERCRDLIADISRRASSAEKAAHRLFGAFLSKAMHFPDTQHVYLVGGKPVLTFWGFVHPDHQNEPDAFACLHAAIEAARVKLSFDLAQQETDTPAPEIGVVDGEATPESPAPLSIPDMPVVEEPAVAAKKPRRRRLGWTLPIVVVLAAVALHIRGCVSEETHEPDMAALNALKAKEGVAPGPAIPETGRQTPPAAADAKHNGLPETTVPEGKSDIPGVTPPTRSLNTGVVGVRPAGEKTLLNGANTITAVKAPDIAGHFPGMSHVNQPTAAKNITDVKSAKPVTEADAKSAADGAEPVAAVPAAPVDKNALTLAPDAVKRGSTDFLNGSWRASLGGKDAQAGKRQVLKYRFKHGQGVAQMTLIDGKICKAPVEAGLMKSGNLVIHSRVKARCDDGARHQLPEVVCRQGATGITECNGRYDDDATVPITMKRESKS